MFAYRYVAGLVLMPLLLGCTSFSSVLLHRGEDNQGWEREKHLHGIPITLKVPTHVRVDILAKHVFLLDDGTVKRSRAPFALRELNYNFIETEKIFTVDVKRPAAGRLNATVDLDPENQYLKQISEQLADETISEVGNLIAAIAPGGLVGLPTNDSRRATALDERVKEVTSVVASQVFEVDAPDFELQVMQFLNRHLNCCHDCGVLPVDALPPHTLPGNYEFPTEDTHPANGGRNQTPVGWAYPDGQASMEPVTTPLPIVQSDEKE